ncbi:2-C-methyl-D-erythritol 4-phosphate cytidylyltransferase [Cohnella kolymensis]|uniref:2-C-methyl-D-erythritol 4-phosphate cytidylyltransferase n=1 Tax=Cohnella kolymensis TaxID=1590652 RepID=A0ABR5A273_9BACL|nr:2-C-methyl-D-erythritol 4-phosphate cytidylyltransferase [Cohnella kolymensis]KIL34512.1 2-C-methyl-D-erythritol 4-phosphate cytidylyltransferase [Cohnella kolymensis]
MMTWGAVVVAAGRGTRMRAGENKPYLLLGGRPVLAHTLDAFERCPAVASIVVIAAPGEEARAAELVRAEGFHKVTSIETGGRERQQSVFAGLSALDTDGVLVHDAARPFVTSAHIESCCRAAQAHGASALAVPVKDTIKVSDGKGFIVDTPDRSTLWSVQTPQAFSRIELIEAHRRAQSGGTPATDDAMLLERMGRKIAIVVGDYTNFKITTPEDLLLAEMLLTRRHGEKSRDD